MYTRFPKTAKPRRVALSFDTLEDRVAVSEQISTLMAVLLATGGAAPVGRRVAHLSSVSASPFGLKSEAAAASVPSGVIPSERIAVVAAAATPVGASSERPAWKTDSLNPGLAGELEQEPLALDLTFPAPRPLRGGMASDSGTENTLGVAATGGSGSVAPDGGSSRGLFASATPAGPATAGLAAISNAELTAAALGNHPAAGTGTPAAPAQNLTPSTGANSNPGTPPPNGKPPFVPPRHPGHHTTDPVNVLDANNAIVLNQNVIKHDYSGYTVSLYAQVSGATVQSYTWSWDPSIDYLNVSGQGTYKLSFQWGSFPGIHAHTISLQTTNVGGGGETLTFPYLVYGTDSPGYTATQPTTYGTWSTVLQPDALKGDQDTVAGQFYSVGLDTGALTIDHALPSYNPGVAPLDLEYSSTAADRKNIFVTHYQVPAGRTDIPNTVVATLTLTGGSGQSTTFSTSGAVNPGDIMEIALKDDEAGMTTGRYGYTVQVVANYTSAPTQVTTNYLGTVSVLDPSTTIFGHGWSLANVERVWPISGSPGAGAGAIVELPGGQSLWFATPLGGGFTTPAGDFSTLVQNGDNTYTRTLSDGTKINFNTSGYETSQVDRNNNALTFSYSGTNLVSITDLNNQITTLAYSGGQVSTMTDPANRVATLTYDASGGRLISIQGPDPGNGASIPNFTFSYSASDRIQTIQDPRGNTATIGYVSGRVATITRMDGVTESLTPMQLEGLNNTIVLAAEAQATYTDGETNQWLSQYDWLGFGRATQQLNPRTDVTAMVVNQRDPNGLPWLKADELARRTRYQYDSLGNPTLIGYPDDTKEQYTYNSFSQPTSFTDANNKVTNYSRDLNGNLTMLQLPSPDGIKPTVTIGYTYLSAQPGGRVQSVTDANGNTTSIAYASDRRNLAISVTFPYEPTLGFSPFITLTYDSYGNITALRDPRGYITSWGYDGLNREIRETLPAQSGPNPVYTYTYDADGNQVSEINPLNKTFSAAFDQLGHQISATDPLLHASTFVYDNAGDLIAVKDALLDITTFGYDGANDWVEQIDANAHTWIYGVDAAGQRISTTSPLGYTDGNYTTTFAFTPVGLLQKRTDPLGNWISYAYNATGDLTGVDEHDSNPLTGQPADYFSTFAYDNLHNETSYTDPRDIAIAYQYDNNGNETSVAGAPTINLLGTIGPGPGHPAIAYKGGDLGDAVIGAIGAGSGPAPVSGPPCAPGCDCVHSGGHHGGTDGGIDGGIGRGIGTGIGSDGGIGNSIGGIGSDGGIGNGIGGIGTDRGSGSHGIDQNGLGGRGGSGFSGGTDSQFANVGSIASGNYTFAYDTRGNPTQRNSSTAPSLVYGYSYDEDGNFTRYSPPSGSTLGGTLVYAYDAQDRLLSRTDALGGIISYGYDLAGRLTSVTDPDLNVTQYTYDDANRLSYATDARGKTFTYTYNAANRLIETIDRDNRTITILYDAAGRVMGETWVGGNYSVAYTYDDANRLTSEKDAYSAYTFAYDQADHLTQVDNNNTPGVPRVILNYGYDGFGNRNSLTDNLASNDSLTYTYNTDRQQTGETWNIGGAQKAQVVLAYDNSNRLYRIDRSVPSTTTLLTTTLSYDPNAAYRVTNLKSSYGSTTLDSFTYTYDARDRVMGYNGPDGNLTYTYDGTDQLTQVTGAHPENYGYDANGNRNTGSYVVDPGNRLRSDGTYTYSYDNEGNMLTKTLLSDSTKYVHFTWDYRNRLVGAVSTLVATTYNVTFTYDAENRRIGKWVNGTQTWTAYDGPNAFADFNGSTLGTRYLYGDKADELFARYNSGSPVAWYLTDLLGSVRQIVDANGNSLDQINYDSFGNILSETSSSNGGRFKYMGREWDLETGFYYFRQRYYDPSAGRFANEDPIGFLGHDSNLYRFVGNDPSNFNDPYGLEACQQEDAKQDEKRRLGAQDRIVSNRQLLIRQKIEILEIQLMRTRNKAERELIENKLRLYRLIEKLLGRWETYIQSRLKELSK